MIVKTPRTSRGSDQLNCNSDATRYVVYETKTHENIVSTSVKYRHILMDCLLQFSSYLNAILATHNHRFPLITSNQVWLRSRCNSDMIILDYRGDEGIQSVPSTMSYMASVSFSSLDGSICPNIFYEIVTPMLCATHHTSREQKPNSTYECNTK